MEIILVRHGETEWNRQEIFRGRIDVGLNETGIKQAERLARYLSRVKLTAVYASPLSRARKTTELICRHHNLTASVTNGLIDLDYGRWQGQKHQEVKESYPELYAEWLEHPQRMKIPDGESLSDVRRRALRIVKKVVVKHEGTVVLVSHRVVNKVLTCALLGLDNSHFWNIKQDTAGITTFTHEDGRFILIEHNNTSFLKSLPKASPVDFYALALTIRAR
jgi:broad specificity phosphatase PhoE